MPALAAAELHALEASWGNREFAAPRPFLREMLRHVEETDGPIYECGTGLTTLVLSAVAPDREIHCFESQPSWHSRITYALPEDSPCIVHLCDLRETRTGPWYDISRLRLPKAPASLIIVDGPAGGNRSGYVSSLAHYIGSPTVIICDDANRDWENIELQRNSLPNCSAEYISAGRGIGVLRLYDEVANA